MSAFFVSPETIADSVALVDRFENWGLVNPNAGDPLTFGKTLWRLNVKALNQRYGPDKAWLECLDEVDATTAFPAASASDKQLVHSLNCLLYQCSEGNVPETPLFKFLSAVAEQAEARFGRGGVWDRTEEAAQ